MTTGLEQPIGPQQETSVAASRGRSTTPSVLFLNQGRASDNGVLGIERVEGVLRENCAADSRITARFEKLPPFSGLAKCARTPIRPLGRLDFAPARWQLARSAVARRRVRGVLRDSEVDAIHVTTHVPALLFGSVFERLPVSVAVDVPIWEWQRTLRGLPPGAPVAFDMAGVVALERKAFERAALVLAWTDTVKHQIESLSDHARVVRHHDGVDLTRFRPLASRPSQGPLRVLFVGNRFEQKGGLLLLEALRSHLDRGVRLDVVTGAQVGAVDGVRVHRLSPGEELAELFRAADVFCLPSGADAVPWVLLEAMASATPVVACPVGSVGELVSTRGAGLLVPAGDAAALREALERLFDDAVLRREMGENGRAECEERFDARKQGTVLVDLLLDARDRFGRPQA